VLVRLDSSRSWSLEGEMDLQLRALDERTKFLSTLPSSSAEPLVFYLKMLADHRRLLAEFLAERDWEQTERQNQARKAAAFYAIARFCAAPTLSPAHPVRLGLALNYATFCCEVLAKPEAAAHAASVAYDQALAEWQNHAALAAAGSGGGPTAATGAASSGQSGAGGANGSQAGSSAASQGGNGALNGSSADKQASTQSTALSANSYKDSLLIMQLLKNNLTMWAHSL
jgi:hypothetical protein